MIFELKMDFSLSFSTSHSKRLKEKVIFCLIVLKIVNIQQLSTIVWLKLDENITVMNCYRNQKLRGKVKYH
jgi:hypothetical protein